MNLPKILRRIIMSIIFTGALYTTVTVITNLTYADIQVWIKSDVQASSQVSSNVTVNDRQVALNKKQKLTYEELEQSINFNEYPSDTVVATGYTAGIESTGKSPDHPEYGITFSGVQVKRDQYSTIAADLDVYPLGTILYIPGYGYGIVADKGSAIKGNKIDLYFHTVEDVYAEWGKQAVEVYVIEIGNGQVTEEDIAALNSGRAVQVGTN